MLLSQTGQAHHLFRQSQRQVDHLLAQAQRRLASRTEQRGALNQRVVRVLQAAGRQA